MSIKITETYILETLKNWKFGFSQRENLDFRFHIASSFEKHNFNFAPTEFSEDEIEKVIKNLSENHKGLEQTSNIWDFLKIRYTESCDYPEELLGDLIADRFTVHLDFIFPEQTVFLYKNLKYLFHLAKLTRRRDEFIWITVDSKMCELEILKFLFVEAIEKHLKGKMTFSKLKMIYLSEKTIIDDTEILIHRIKKVWLDSIIYAGLDVNSQNLKIEDFFLIEIKNGQGTKSIDGVIGDDNISKAKNYLGFKDIYIKNFPDFSSSILLEAESIVYLPKDVKFDQDFQKIQNSFLIGKIFNDLWLTSNNVINHWGSYVSKGKVIENFGSNVSGFLTGMLEEFEKTLPHELKNNNESLDKIRELSDMVQGRIISLFTSQLLILQTQALDKFKDILVWQAKNSSKDFEFDKSVAMLEVNEWFENKATKIVIPEMRLDSTGAKRELQQVLGEVTEKFKESAVAKLISVEKTSKKTSKGKLKQGGIVIGFGITTAVRPRGFGNLQLVTSYSQGPHVFNFSLVNDMDVAEQEGQTRIKPVRIQPSLNFDIDI
jgi:hypothetical protein